MNRNHANVEKKMSQLPSWLWTTSNLLPPVYRQIWEGVRESKPPVYTSATGVGELLVDTNKVFPLLLTSQLPTEVLGYIWSLANHKFAGQLTEQELYVVLALVAIAQASYTFNSLDVLHLTPTPPIPNLNLSVLDGKNVLPVKFEPKPTQPANSSFDINDEFSEFQSAPAVNIPSISMLDMKQGSAIGSRLANHNLGVKKPGDKPKKINGNKNCSNNQLRNSNGKEQISGDQLADLFPKCSLKTQSKVVILKDTAIRSSELSRDGNYVVKDDAQFIEKIPSALENNFVVIPGPLNNAVPKNELEAARIDLMSVQPFEDKYSALRVLVEEPQLAKTETESNVESLAVDDFGDFVSAVQPEALPVQEPIDFFSDFEFKEQNIGSAIDNMLIQNFSDSFSNLRTETNADPIVSSEKFDETNDSGKNYSKSLAETNSPIP